MDTTEVHRVTVTDLQLEFLRRMSALDPPVWIMGGYAEDALLAGTVTRAHEDIDWLFPRREYELRLAQAKRLGFPEFGVWGESAPGQPFYLSADQGELRLELGIVDEEEGALWIKVYELGFQIEGSKPAAGYRVQLPDNTFQHPPVELDGISVRPISPLALYQLRVGIAGQGSFGELTEKQHRSMHLLQERFFVDRTDDELKPRVLTLHNP
jgi:hypothetical protein